MNESVLHEMVVALQQEADAAKRLGATRTNVLRNGRLQDTRHGHLYLFNIDRPLSNAMGNDFPGEVEIQGQIFQATIAELRDTEILVLLPRNFGISISVAYLHTDLTYLLTLLAERLPSILDRSDYFPSQAAKVLNQIQARVGRNPAKLAWPVDKKNHSPNLEQLNAVDLSLGSEVCFIFGPPGTGKTKTIAAIGKELLSEPDGKILITSHTNVAADNALQALLKYDHDPTISEILREGLAVRVGTIVVKDPELEKFHIDRVTQKIEEQFKRDRANLLEQLNVKEHGRNRLKETVAKWELLQNLRRRRVAHETLRREFQQEIQRLHQSQATVRQNLEQNRLRYAEAVQNNFLVNLWKGFSKRKLLTEKTRLEAEDVRLTKSLAEATRRATVLEEERKKIDKDVQDFEHQVPAQHDFQVVSTELDTLDRALSELRTQIDLIDQKIADLQRNVLERAKVIISSLTQTYVNRALLPQRFTTAIIDEASTAPIPAITYASALASKRVVLVGDPKQLPPICISEGEVAKKWLGRDIYGVAGVSYKAKNHDPRIAFLRKQYRMHEEIFQVVNQHFYDGELENEWNEADASPYRSLWPGEGSRLVLVDTHKALPFMGVERRKRSQSRFNLYHVEVVVEILRYWLEEVGIKPDVVGVIAPYRSQINFLTERIHEKYKDVYVEVGTVHTFQGREKDCIIFDTVESFGPARSVGLLLNDAFSVQSSGDTQADQVSRLLAVASSRAKEKFLCIANLSHLEESLPTYSITRRWVSKIASKAMFDATILVPYYIPRKDASEASAATLFNVQKDEEGPNRRFQTAREFFSHFHQDLAQAKEKVIIFSAYVFPDRLSREAPYLQDLVRRDIKTLVFTKPAKERFTQQSEVESLHKQLQKIGVKLFPFEGTHHKFAIIDNRILYHGSLNILSWNGETKEVMCRSESPAEIQQLISLLVRENPKLRTILADEAREFILDVAGLEKPKTINDLIETLRPNDVFIIE